MPLYYLHLCDGWHYSEADEGQEYADLGAASLGAVLGLRDALASDVLDGRINLTAYVEIENADRRHLATVHFADAVAVCETSVRAARAGD